MSTLEHQERRSLGSAAQGAGAGQARPQRGRRLVRPRRSGYRTPAGVRYAGKPTDLANPFERRPVGDGRYAFGQARAFKLHQRWAKGRLGALALERLGFDPGEIAALGRMRERLLRILPHLRGQDLQCWCALKSRFCHVDTVLDLVARLPA